MITNSGIDVEVYHKFEGLYGDSAFFVAYGGRGGMKTFEFSQALVLQGAQRKLNVVCGRQFQNSIEESVYKKIIAQIKRLGLESEYKILDNSIRHLITGTTFSFKGLDRNIESSKGWDEVDILWIEEGEILKYKTIEILFPSIRKDGARIWISMNTGARTDPVYKRFLSKDADLTDTIVVKTYWWENRHHPRRLELERRIFKKMYPHRYAHVWEGEPDDERSSTPVLPYAQLLRCVDAHKKLGYDASGMKYSGLDVADEGADTNCWSCRQGSLLQSVIEWKAKYLHITSARADSLNKSHSVASMHYDAGGLGAGIKSDLSRMPRNPADGTGPGVKKFIPFLFGGKVYGPNRFFIRSKDLKIRNKDFFSKANAQAWWNVKLRVQNTIKALEGENVDLDMCFFIPGDLEDLENILAELSQCVYDDSTGKIVVDKAPDNAPSPNKADSIIMAYVHDIKRGLKAG